VGRLQATMAADCLLLAADDRGNTGRRWVSRNWSGHGERVTVAKHAPMPWAASGSGIVRRVSTRVADVLPPGGISASLRHRQPRQSPQRGMVAESRRPPGATLL